MNADNTGFINNQKRLNTILKLAVAFAAVTGFGIALLALISAIGVWLGLWNFGSGFDILGFAHGHAPWVSIVALGLGFLLLAANTLPAARNATRFGVIALLASGAAALSWAIPETYRPPEGTPAIHDITTDTVNPPEFVDVMPLRGPDSNPVEYGTMEGMTPERQAQLQAEAYPDIQPLVLDASPDEVFQRALAAVDELGWELVSQVPEEGRIEATDTTFWFRFKDDVVIRIQETDEGTRLDARSTSRVGRSDVGKNAERLRNFFDAL